eukprot:350955-Chlamydomonas_euryale.AAC.7
MARLSRAGKVWRTGVGGSRVAVAAKRSFSAMKGQTSWVCAAHTAACPHSGSQFLAASSEGHTQSIAGSPRCSATTSRGASQAGPNPAGQTPFGPTDLRIPIAIAPQTFEFQSQLPHRPSNSNRNCPTDL